MSVLSNDSIFDSLELSAIDTAANATAVEASLSSVGCNVMGICGCPNIVLRNGMKLDAGRAEQKISASIPVRLIGEDTRGVF